MTRFIKQIFNNSGKAKRIRNYVQIQSISVFIAVKKFTDFQ